MQPYCNNTGEFIVIYMTTIQFYQQCKLNVWYVILSPVRQNVLKYRDFFQHVKWPLHPVFLVSDI